MRNGFASPTLVLGILAGVLALGLAVQTKRVESAKAELAAFVAQVEANGKAAELAKQKREADDKANKQRIDNETDKLRSANATLARQLRDQRAASRFVPDAPASAKRPDAISYDRAKLERALQQLDAGVSDIVAAGDAARIDLNLALKWARDMKP